MSNLPESDWKLLRSSLPAMLEEFSHRLNAEVQTVLTRENLTPNEKRLRIYKLVHEGDRIVGECFDDWRRSRVIQRCWSLRRHGLLSDAYLEKLTEPTRSRIVLPL